jgi:hypothetical protein
MWVFPRARTRNGPSLSVLVSSVLRSSRRARAAREHHETSKRVGSGSRASREISPGPGPVVSREIQHHPSSDRHGWPRGVAPPRQRPVAVGLALHPTLSLAMPGPRLLLVSCLPARRERDAARVHVLRVRRGPQWLVRALRLPFALR